MPLCSSCLKRFSAARKGINNSELSFTGFG